MSEQEKRGRGRPRIGSERVFVTCPPWLIAVFDAEVAAHRASCRSDAARQILIAVAAKRLAALRALKEEVAAFGEVSAEGWARYHAEMGDAHPPSDIKAKP